MASIRSCLLGCGRGKDGRQHKYPKGKLSRGDTNAACLLCWCPLSIRTVSQTRAGRGQCAAQAYRCVVLVKASNGTGFGRTHMVVDVDHDRLQVRKPRLIHPHHLEQHLRGGHQLHWSLHLHFGLIMRAWTSWGYMQQLSGLAE